MPEIASETPGHYKYDGKTGNRRRLSQFPHGVIRRWDRFIDILKCYPLPQVKIVHSTLKA